VFVCVCVYETYAYRFKSIHVPEAGGQFASMHARMHVHQVYTRA
jgi:hypothetical protein